MSGAIVGAVDEDVKAQAVRLGVPVAEVLEARELGRRWCVSCRAWRATDAFATASRCAACPPGGLRGSGALRVTVDYEAIAAKTSARKLGIPVEDVLAHRAAGRRWCSRCKTWLALAAFGRDAHRRDGRARKCRPCTVAAAVASQGRTVPAAGPGQVQCASCPRAAPFQLQDGRPACAKCLKKRVKERKSR